MGVLMGFIRHLLCRGLLRGRVPWGLWSRHLEFLHDLRMRFCPGYRLERLRIEHMMRVGRSQMLAKMRKCRDAQGHRGMVREQIDTSPLGTMSRGFV